MTISPEVSRISSGMPEILIEQNAVLRLYMLQGVQHPLNTEIQNGLTGSRPTVDLAGLTQQRV